MNKVWFTADTHFGHANIMKYANRPFMNVRQMDESLIRKWNERVNPDDDVFHLGDFCFGYFEDYFPHLNGHIHFIEGNHDKNLKLFKGRFATYKKFSEIKVGSQDITLVHYAMRVWNKSHHGAWHLYGHSHGSLPDDSHSLSFDVGVDCHNYAPISFEEVAAIMAKKTFKPIDHHGQ